MSDDIIDRIDDVITGWEGSRDSMRWSPDPPQDEPVERHYEPTPEHGDPEPDPAPTGILRVEHDRPGAWWHRWTRRDNGSAS